MLVDMAISLTLMGLVVDFAVVYFVLETYFASFGSSIVDWLVDLELVVLSSFQLVSLLFDLLIFPTVCIHLDVHVLVLSR